MSRTTADRLMTLAEELGFEADLHVASTGSRYLTIERPSLGLTTTIRVSDHADAYATAAYTCDGVEGDAAGARRHLLASMRTSERALRRLRRLRRRRARRERHNSRMEWICGYAAQRGVSLDEAAAACPIK